MKITNLYYNNYLSNCDLISKYNYKNRYQIFDIKSIVFEFPIIQINNSLSYSISSKSMNLKSYFLFYILFYFKPYINYKLIKNQDKNYSLKFQIFNKSQIHNFIHIFFMNFFSNKFFNFFFNIKHLDFKNILKQNESQKINVKFLNLFKINNFDIKEKSNIINLNFKMPVFCFYILDFYLNNIFENINLKELFFFINIIIINSKPFTTKTLKNFPCFWVFNSYKKKF